MAFSPAPLLGVALLLAGVLTATAPGPSPATGRSPAAGVEGLAGPEAQPPGRGAGPSLLRAPALATAARALTTAPAGPARAAAARPTAAARTGTREIPTPGAVNGEARAAWRWPLAGPPRVVRGFAPGPHPWSPGHRGVDLAPATGDAAVLAPAAGVVTFAGPVAGRGVVVIAHADGLRTSLEPVTASVAVGTVVAAGRTVGTLGATGSHCSPATCLHWGVRRGETYVDPLTLVTDGRPVVLLPWDP